MSREELKKAFDSDESWRSADGRRYEAMLVLEDGTAFGRLGAAPQAPRPDESNDYGGFRSEIPPDSEIQRGIERLEAVGDRHATSPALGTISSGNAAKLPGILGGTLADDRRARVSSTALLTSFPVRTVGALNSVAAAGYSDCTGTKIGPRHVLTAAHCVVDEFGQWTTSGYFHPGQTNTTHPNTSGTAVHWSGVYARDWRGYNGYDYAILYLDDRLDSFNLSWVGVQWWTSSSGYNGRLAEVLGYPWERSTDFSQKCQASIRLDKSCDGWMYRHGAVLTSTAYAANAQLKYDIDTTSGQSGSSVLSQLPNGVWVTLGVHWGCDQWLGCPGNNPRANQASRFRSSMWNDVCDWIGAVDSVWGSHGLCP